MKVEILFHTSSTPKTMDDVLAIYTKGGLLCIQRSKYLIERYPLCNVFSVTNFHQPHLGCENQESRA